MDTFCSEASVYRKVSKNSVEDSDMSLSRIPKLCRCRFADRGKMEDFSPVAVTLTLGNPAYENSGISDHMRIRRLQIVPETAAALRLDPTLMLDGSSSCKSHDCGGQGAILATSSLPGESKADIMNVETSHYSEERSLQRGVSNDALPESVKPSEEPRINSSVVSFLSFKGKDPIKNGVRSVFEMDCMPLWGSVSLCGHRPEMEDAITTAPHFTKIPIELFIGSNAIDGISQKLHQLSSHFFGVFDGHGGSEVANYCRERVHMVLIDELKNCKEDIANVSNRGARQLQWEKVFSSCFTRVDGEVGGKVSQGIPESGDHPVEPVAPETVGSTAVVAVISSSHIIVANCGDSRAVLYRGKEAIALSVDHKPNREDECARIEACGGKVIPWNGHRVFGVLAMSRSIGDRYMKPSIIPEPEVMLVPRAKEDECLVLASDGLWDVMTNEEACQVAKRRILIWHKRNNAKPLTGYSQGVDPAAQAAAEYLSNFALQKGSMDNISIIVVDLKTQRKLKNKV